MKLHESKVFMDYFTGLNMGSKMQVTRSKTRLHRLMDRQLMNFALVALLAMLVKFMAEYGAEELKHYLRCNGATHNSKGEYLCQQEQLKYRTK